MLARKSAWLIKIGLWESAISSAIMYLIYKKIKKRNARKKLEEQLQRTTGHSETPVGVSEMVLETEPKIAPKLSETVPEKESSPEEKAAKKKRRVYRWKLILGLFGPFCLQSLDTTIIASALPYIAEDFRKFLTSNQGGELRLTKHQTQTKSVS